MQEGHLPTTPHFLKNGGELGELTRNFDWSKTSIGSPEQWPQNLRLTLSMILSSKFPMFLWWGKDLVQFYNDAYRPSLGNEGKHPLALGQKGEECWPEIWVIIHPLIIQVQTTGQATWSEDQLIPIFRNGKIEDVYWTFSYSPIYREDERSIDGVLVVCTETTEKVQSRKLVEESEERFRNMAEGADILIATSDETDNATYFNSAWTQMTGKKMQELLNFGWADLLHEEDYKTFLPFYRESSKKRQPWIREFRLRDKDGNYRWLYVKGTLRFRHDGAFAGYISSSIDITQRKKAEEKLRESEQQVRTIVASAPFPIGVFVGKEMRIILANQTILDIWGKGNNVIGKSYMNILPEFESQAIFDQLSNVLNTGNPFHAQNQRVDIEIKGELQAFYFNYSLTPLYDTSGKVYGIMNTAADVTDLNVAKRRLEQSESNFRNMVLQAPVAMCILSGPEYVVEVANDLIIELWGKLPDSVLEKPLFEGLPDAKNQGLEQLLWNVYTNGETFKADERPVSLLRNGKNETVYLNFVYEPYRDVNGKVVGVLAVAVDVTSQVIVRHRIEELVAERTKELADTNHHLQKSNSELAQFAYIASHDLQEPLRKISVFSQLLENSIGSNADEPSKNYLQKIRSSSVRMNKLIRDVLIFSELVNENQQFIEVNINTIIDDIKTDYELLIEETGALITYENLPVLEAVPLQMTQLFNNLIGNSLKFARKDITPLITITATELTKQEQEKLLLFRHPSYYKIQLTDNGIGFKPEHADQIFNIFQRLHRKSEYEGTGIGLSMCKKIVLNHHGDINADGSSENGAVFNVILPIKNTDLNE
ncbi:MAG: PAS domain S-box protein [Bacteroidia bacterium]